MKAMIAILVLILAHSAIAQQPENARLAERRRALEAELATLDEHRRPDRMRYMELMDELAQLDNQHKPHPADVVTVANVYAPLSKQLESALNAARAELAAAPLECRNWKQHENHARLQEVVKSLEQALEAARKLRDIQ